MKNPVLLSVLLVLAITAQTAFAEVQVYRCQFTDVSFVITIYGDDTLAKIGTEVGVGDDAKIYEDAISKSLVAVEFNGTGQPITLTTINKGGGAVHSRHVLDLGGVFSATQRHGKCNRGAIQ